MASSNLTVMSPNGHRVVLKVNNNSPLCLGLEEACNQFELESSWFGLKHIKRFLDISSTVRQSGVPNNATLELYKLEKERVTASVRIALLLPDGGRLMGVHPASTCLWEVLSTTEKEGELVTPLCYPGGIPTRVPCLEYAKIKVIGEDELRSRNLKNIGILAGSVVIRYSAVELQDIPKVISEDVVVLKGYNRPVPVPEQPNRHPPSSNPPPFPIHQMTVLGQGISEVDPAFSNLLNTPWSFDLKSEEELKREEERKKPRELFSNPGGWSHEKGPFENVNLGAILTQALIPVVPPEEDYIAQFNQLRAEKTGEPLPQPDEDNPPLVIPAPDPPNIEPITHISPVQRVYEEACPRDTCVFHLDKNEYSDVIPVELDDAFFQPTMSEAAKRQKELEKQNAQLNDSPLTIQTYKKAREVSNLDKYDKTVIRVILPNRLVLQGVFRSGEPVRALVSFIRESLVDPKLKFHLFTTPPKKVIKNGKVTFKEANLIPASNVLLALDETAEGLLLQEDLLDQVATQLEADVKSSKERATVLPTDNIGTVSASSEPAQSRSRTQKGRRQGSGDSKGTGKPKWLKVGK